MHQGGGRIHSKERKSISMMKNTQQAAAGAASAAAATAAATPATATWATATATSALTAPRTGPSAAATTVAGPPSTPPTTAVFELVLLTKSMSNDWPDWIWKMYAALWKKQMSCFIFF